MKLRSVNFRDNEELPYIFSSYNDSPISPSMYWTDFPDNTMSFVLIMRGPSKIHWFLLNIPREINFLKPNEIAGVELIPYTPPDKDGVYRFEVYALDRMIYDIKDEPDFKQYVLDQASINVTV